MYRPPGLSRLHGASMCRPAALQGVVLTMVATLGSPAFAESATPAQTLPSQEIHIGVMAPEGVSDVLHDWRFVAPALQAALPGHVVRIEQLDEKRLRERIAQSRMDFFIANSGFFVEMAAAHGANALATVDGPSAVSPREALGSALVVLSSRSDLRDMGDLRGRRVIAVSEGLFGGFQIGLHALQKAGVRRKELRSLEFVAYDLDRLLEDLQANRADAAIMRRCLLEKLTARPQFRRAAFRVLNERPPDGSGCARSTILYPDWAFASLKRTDPELSRSVTLALLRMPRTGDGHAWSVPTDYDSVHGVLRDLEVGPYEYLSARTLAGFFERSRFALSLMGLLVFGAIAHVTLAEWQVKRRTAELRRALAERDRMAADVRQREEELLHLSRLGALGEMSSMLAHELAQPLASIGNFAHGIVRRLDAGLTDPAPLADAGGEIARQAERAGAIMQRVRSFAAKRVEARVPVDVEDVVRSAAALLRGMAPDAPAVDVIIEVAQCRAAATRAMVDRLQLEQVLLNLYKNAMDAMAGMPAARRRIEVGLHRAGEHVEIEVRDHGDGLTAETLQHLFQPFFTTKTNGVGLGLAICRRVIEAHGGHIGARVGPGGRGLVVWIQLPGLSEQQHAPAPGPAAGTALVREKAR